MTFENPWTALSDDDPISSALDVIARAVRAGGGTFEQGGLSAADHLIYFHLWVISAKAWKSWPANVQTAVFEAAKEAALQNHKLRIDQDRRIYDEFASKGVRILEPDRAAFAARLIDVQDSVNSELQPLLQRIRAVQ